MSEEQSARLVVLISGNGSNLQAILDAAPNLPARVVCVISNKPSAFGLERARRAGVPAVAYPCPVQQDRRDYDAGLAAVVASYQPDWVVLAGWMRLLSNEFLKHFPGQVVNLHPALPGAFPGVDAIARAYEAYQRGEITQTGVMVHLVPDAGVDSGPVLAQEAVPILPADTLNALEARVHTVEHRLLVETLRKLIAQENSISVHIENHETQTAAYLERIHQILAANDPEAVIQSYTVNHDGLANHVLIINGESVFRFAFGEYGRKALQAERKILKAIEGKMPLPTPAPFYQADDMLAYHFLAGQALGRERLLNLPDSQQQVLADQLGQFLYQLHQIAAADLPHTLAPITVDAWRGLSQRVRERIYPLLLPHQRSWAEELLSFAEKPENFIGPVSLIHGDLAPYHILYNPKTQKLSGVIDFGVAGLGDPASDLGCLLQNYGLGFVQRMSSAYPDLKEYLPRARFYAQAIELQWVLLGLESGEPFWFTAHLGAARDDLSINHLAEQKIS